MTTHPESLPDHFVEAFDVPMGLPWDQARAALLKARHSAPVATDEVLISLRRIEPWRSDRPAHYAAAYIRRESVEDQRVLWSDIDGRRVKFTFVSRDRQRKVWRDRLVHVGLAGACLVAVGLAALSAVDQRSQGEGRLETAERNAQLILAAQARARDVARRAHVVELAGLTGRSGSNVLADIAWLATAKLPQARLTDVGWDGLTMYVAAAGSERPVTALDRTVTPISTSETSSLWKISKSATAPRADGLPGAPMATTTRQPPPMQQP